MLRDRVFDDHETSSKKVRSSSKRAESVKDQMSKTAKNCFKVVNDYKIADDNISNAAEERLIKICVDNQQQED